MNSKLTLSLHPSVISAAKKYAAENKTSISQLVESYFLDLIYAEPKRYPKQVRELIGLVKVQDPPVDYKAEKLKYLEEKYLSS